MAKTGRIHPYLVWLSENRWIMGINLLRQRAEWYKINAIVQVLSMRKFWYPTRPPWILHVILARGNRFPCGFALYGAVVIMIIIDLGGIVTLWQEVNSFRSPMGRLVTDNQPKYKFLQVIAVYLRFYRELPPYNENVGHNMFSQSISGYLSFLQEILLGQEKL